MDRPVRVAVLGSCTTRDNFNSRFNPDYKQTWDCVLLQNQSSLLSLMSLPTEIEDDDIGAPDDFSLSVVRSDLNKEFLDRVVELAPEYLIMDFFGDVHFGCLRLESGALVTDNRWHLQKTSFYQRLKAAGELEQVHIQDDVESYMAEWTDAYDRLARYLRTHLPDLQLVVHRGFNTNRVQVEGSRVVPLQEFKRLRRLRVKQSNQLWKGFDDYAVEVGGAHEIDLTQGGYTSFDEHPWGPFYVHYTMDYYRDFLAELNLLHLRRTMASSGRTVELRMLDQVQEAAAARAELLVERRARRIARLRRRVKELEAQVASLQTEPLGRAVRRSAGRLVRVRMSWLGRLLSRRHHNVPDRPTSG